MNQDQQEGAQHQQEGDHGSQDLPTPRRAQEPPLVGRLKRLYDDVDRLTTAAKRAREDADTKRARQIEAAAEAQVAQQRQARTEAQLADARFRIGAVEQALTS